MGDKMKKLLLLLLVLFFSCEDDRVALPVQESIRMWLDGTEIPVYDYYESITTYGVSTHAHEAHEGDCNPSCPLPEDIKKIFVIHFQKDGGRVTPEKEHYALIFYDVKAEDNADLIDEGVYINPSSESTKGITLEIVGASDYTTNAQGIIDNNEDNIVDGFAEGTFFNPYSNAMQNGLLMFENVTIGTDTANTFYSEYY
jgi:hypothetical protein